jgi:protein TonB
MAEAGFLEQKAVKPSSAALVVLMHGAGIAALLLLGTEIVKRDPPTRTDVTTVDLPDPPPTPPEPPTDNVRPQQQPSRLDTPPTPSPFRSNAPPVTGTPIPPGPVEGIVGPEPQPFPPQPQPREETPPPAPPPPVRTEAQLDPRASELQPPYPASEQRDQREGSVAIRITIGTNGRVIATQRVSATSDAFYSATERHARARWRFRPATLDGRPVEASRVMTVRFTLNDD